MGEHVTRNTARAREDVFEEVRRRFSEVEIVELTLMSGLFNRFTDSLRLPVEEQSEVDKIKRSVRLAPEKVRACLEGLGASPLWKQENADEDGGGG